MNSRIFRFRIWGTREKRWIDEALVTLHAINIWNHSDNERVTQQFTGCYDAYNTEIYEGDIVEYKDNDIIKKGVVGFTAGIFFVNWPDETDDELGYMLVSNIKVIGNIFEHSELLN